MLVWCCEKRHSSRLLPGPQYVQNAHLLTVLGGCRVCVSQGQSKEYGFVEYAFPSQALAALKDLEKQHEAAKRCEQASWGEGLRALLHTCALCSHALSFPPTGGQEAAAHLLNGPGCRCMLAASM